MEGKPINAIQQIPLISPHAVLFYEKPDTMANAAEAFLAEGLRAGDAVVIVATQSMRDSLKLRFTLLGLDLPTLEAEGSYVVLDASETLELFMVGDAPEKVLFSRFVGGAVEKACASSRSGRTRAFGEMVAVLCARGAPEAAIRLEHCWNVLGRMYPLQLLCGYPMDLFRGDENRSDFARICDSHADVLPAESLEPDIEAPKRRSMASLQRPSVS
jgi:hypothetical protein